MCQSQEKKLTRLIFNLSSFQKVNALNSKRSQLFEKLKLSKVNALSFWKSYRFQQLTFYIILFLAMTTFVQLNAEYGKLQPYRKYNAFIS